MWAERHWEMNALDKDIHWQQSYCIQQSVDFGRRGGRAHEGDRESEGNAI